uniref:Uncharacterized protein n=1 Tax=Arundo donax TaxID=35708 RepID=A0A0A9H7A2_ARUDO
MDLGSRTVPNRALNTKIRRY